MTDSGAVGSRPGQPCLRASTNAAAAQRHCWLLCWSFTRPHSSSTCKIRNTQRGTGYDGMRFWLRCATAGCCAGPLEGHTAVGPAKCASHGKAHDVTVCEFRWFRCATAGCCAGPSAGHTAVQPASAQHTTRHKMCQYENFCGCLFCMLRGLHGRTNLSIQETQVVLAFIELPVL
jgi:hypothetical protein